MSTRRWWAAVVGVAALFAGLVAVPATAALRQDDQRFTYVALGGTYVIGPDYAAHVLRDRTGVATAPLGRADFTARSEQFTLTVDDVGALRGGTVPMSIVTITPDWRIRSKRYVCVPVREPLVVPDAVPRDTVSLLVWDAVTGRGCDQPGTAGTLTIED